LSGYLLDTNVVSEVRKPRPHGGVVAWFDTVETQDIFVPAVVVGELQAGAEITRMRDTAKALELDLWIERIISTYQVVSMDASCFREWARLIRGHSDTLREDAMIAATARVHGLTVATRNTGDFAPFSVPVFNPFTYRP